MRTACAPAPAFRRTWWRWSCGRTPRGYARRGYARETADGSGEHIAALSIVTKHVEAGAGRRQQHGVAGAGGAGGGDDGLLHRPCPLEAADPLECRRHERRIL